MRRAFPLAVLLPGLFLAFRVAADDGMPHPRLVTLRNPQISLSQALKELEEQTKVHVTCDAKLEQPLSLDLNGVPFWESLDRIAHLAKGRVHLYTRDGEIALTPWSPGLLEQPVSYGGVFRVAVGRISANEDFGTGAHRYTGRLEVAWEPGFQPLYVESRSRDLTVLDADGKEMPVPDEGSNQYAVTQPRATEIDIPLPTFPRDVRQIGQLKGSLSVIGTAKMLRFAFEALAPGSQTAEGVTVLLGKLTLKGDPWSVQVELTYPPGGPKFESHQSWLLQNQVALVSKDGKRRFEPTGQSIDRLTDSSAVITYYFAEDRQKTRGKPDDWGLTYTTPGRLVEVPVPFAFKHVRLP